MLEWKSDYVGARQIKKADKKLYKVNKASSFEWTVMLFNVSEKKHKYQGKNRSLFFRPTQKNMTLSNFQCTLLPPVRNYLVPSRGCNLQHLTCTPDLQNFWRKTGPHENTKEPRKKVFNLLAVLYFNFCNSNSNSSLFPSSEVRKKFEKRKKQTWKQVRKKSEQRRRNFLPYIHNGQWDNGPVKWLNGLSV